MNNGPLHGPVDLVPFSFDLSTLVPRSLATLYSNLVTRPTGRALRLGIESQIADLGSCCISVLDFTQVAVLDYSCADEAVAKLIRGYVERDRSADVYFVARGLAVQHRDPIECALARHALALVAEVSSDGYALLGDVSDAERAAWSVVERSGRAATGDLARALGCPKAELEDVLESLARRRVVLRSEAPPTYYALSALLA